MPKGITQGNRVTNVTIKNFEGSRPAKVHICEYRRHDRRVNKRRKTEQANVGTRPMSLLHVSREIQDV